jgi:Pro-kumamolisin, activation domain
LPMLPEGKDDRRMLRISWRMLGILVASVLLAGSVGLLALRAVSANVTLAQSTSPALATAQLVGPLANDTNLTITMVLRSRDEASMQRFAQLVSIPGTQQFRHFMTPAAFAQAFGPDLAIVNQAEGYLQNAGMRITNVQSGGLFITAQATALQAASAFHVTINRYQWANGVQFYANAQSVTLPAVMAGNVVAVMGLDSIPLWRHSATQTTPLAQNPSSLYDAQHQLACPVANATQLSPAYLANAYGFPASSVATGSGQRVALYELDGYTLANVTAFAACFAPSVNVGSVVQTKLVDTSSALAPGPDEIEVELDAEVVLGMAPGVAGVDIYEAPNGGAGILDELVKIANDNLDGIVSISWGSCEALQSSGMLNSQNTVFAQMVAQGQSVYVASMDTGAYGCYPFSGTTPQYQMSISDLAGSANVVAVGGSSLTVNGGTGAYTGEVTWNNSPGEMAASGGGISTSRFAPIWQNQTGISPGSGAKRVIPDVAASGDPNKGYMIFTAPGNGGSGLGGTVVPTNTPSWQIVGGTSAATPLWAALSADANQLASGRLGLITPALYALYQADLNTSPGSITTGGAAYYDYAAQVNGAAVSTTTIAFHDITAGNNGLGNGFPGYAARTGYDAATGLGTPYAAVVARYLASLGSGGGLPFFNTPTPGPTATPTSTTTGTPTITPTVTPTSTPVLGPTSSPKLYMVGQANNGTYWISSYILNTVTGAPSATPRTPNWGMLDGTVFQGMPGIADVGNASPTPMLWLAGIGTDNIMRVAAYDPVRASFGGWVTVPGASCSGDAAVIFAAGYLIVGCKTTSGDVVINGYSPATNRWNGWYAIGGGATASPRMATDGSTLLLVVPAPLYSDDTTSTWFTRYTIASGAMTSWQRFATSCVSTPGIAWRGSGTNDYALSCVARDTHSVWASVFAPSTGYPVGWSNKGITSEASAMQNASLAAVDLIDSVPVNFFSGQGSNGGAYLWLQTSNASIAGGNTWQRISLGGIFHSSISLDYYGY